MSQRTDHMTQMYEDLNNLLCPWTIGFDEIFEDVTALIHNATGYPHYNILRESSSRTIIEVALAGLSRDAIKVYEEKDVLHIVYENLPSNNKEEDGGSGPKYLRKGIASRDFHLLFSIVHGFVVSNATMKDGLLRVLFVKVQPPEPVRNFLSISNQ